MYFISCLFQRQLAHLKFGCLISFWARCSLFFCLVSEPGRSEPGALFFFGLVSEPGRTGPGALFFLLGILSQVRGVPADGEKRVQPFFCLVYGPDKWWAS